MENKMTKFRMRRHLLSAGKEAGLLASLLVIYLFVRYDASLRLDLGH